MTFTQLPSTLIPLVLEIFGGAVASVIKHEYPLFFEEVGRIRKSHLVAGIFLAMALLLIVNLSATAQPGAFNLTSPENNENLNDNTPEFQWGAASGADNYRIVIDNDSDLGSPLYDNDNLGTVTSFTLPDENALENDGIYYWGTRAENADGYTWSNENWQFRLDTLGPAGPPMTYPDNNENIKDNTPNLDWTAPAPTENSLPLTYDVWVDDTPGFSSPVITATSITDENYQVQYSRK